MKAWWIGDRGGLTPQLMDVELRTLGIAARRLFIMLGMLVALYGTPVLGQVGVPATGESQSIHGGAGGARTPAPEAQRITGAGPSEILRHRDLNGRACLSVYGFARPYGAAPNIFDHVVSLDNGCSQLIRVEVCYYRTTQCASLQIAGRAHKDYVLGSMPSLKDFQYEFRERF